MYRYRKNFKNYQKLKGDSDCALCEIYDHQIVEQNEHYSVIFNKFPYDIWEHRRVTDHLLIVPKIHATGLTDLPDVAVAAIIECLLRYEHLGYDVYARATGNPMRSVAKHQHTHLIKTTGNPAKISLYLDKPYTVAKF